MKLVSPTGRVLPTAAMPRPMPPRELDPVYNRQPIAPIHLSASVLLQSGASSSVPTAALENPMGQDMEILEVKFEVLGATDLAVNLSGVPFGGSIACDLKLGSYKVTNGAVPVWCFGRAENLGAETKIDEQQDTSYNAYSWRLPRPLFVPAGSVLKPDFTHLGYIAGDLNVRIGYSARTAVRSPKAVCMPWVSAYISRSFNPISSAGSDSSQPQVLMNNTGDPTPQVFHLQRFTGRTIYFATSGVRSETLPLSFPARFLTMRMVDSYGRPIVRTYTPFRSVFGSVTRSWELEELGAQLDPGAFYRVFLKKAAMTLSSAALSASQVQAAVGMVGWREVSL